MAIATAREDHGRPIPLEWGKPSFETASTSQSSGAGSAIQPPPAPRGGGDDTAIDLFYEALELGIEAVASAIAPAREEEEAEAGPPNALVMLSASDDDECSVVTEVRPPTRPSANNDASKSKSEAPRHQHIEVEEATTAIQEGSAGKTPDTPNSIVEDEGIELEAGCISPGCIVNVFPWSCDAKEEEAANSTSTTRAAAKTEDSASARNKRPVWRFPRAASTGATSVGSYLPVVGTGSDEERNSVVSRAVLLQAEVDARRAELELKKIRLETMKVEEEMMEFSGSEDDDDDSEEEEDDDASSSSEQSSSEDSGMLGAMRTFARFTTRRGSAGRRP